MPKPGESTLEKQNTKVVEALAKACDAKCLGDGYACKRLNAIRSQASHPRRLNSQGLQLVIGKPRKHSPCAKRLGVCSHHQRTGHSGTEVLQTKVCRMNSAQKCGKEEAVRRKAQVQKGGEPGIEVGASRSTGGEQRAPVACLQGLVVNEYEGWAGFSFSKLPRHEHCRSPSPFFSSVHRGLGHILDCRCSARCNLQLDLDLAAERRAIFVAGEPLGFWDQFPLAALRSSLNARCELWVSCGTTMQKANIGVSF
eukprot:5186932-Pleurochrysis_carterae.AAC.4